MARWAAGGAWARATHATRMPRCHTLLKGLLSDRHGLKPGGQARGVDVAGKEVGAHVAGSVHTQHLHAAAGRAGRRGESRVIERERSPGHPHPLHAAGRLLPPPPAASYPGKVSSIQRVQRRSSSATNGLLWFRSGSPDRRQLNSCSRVAPCSGIRQFCAQPVYGRRYAAVSCKEGRSRHLLSLQLPALHMPRPPRATHPRSC